MAIERRGRNRSISKVGKFIIIFIAIAFIIVALRGYQLYGYVFNENVKSEKALYIPEVQHTIRLLIHFRQTIC